MPKRIGEILLEHGWVDWEALALAIGDQRGSGMRLCSHLVERGAVTFDVAARALGLQHSVAAAMSRHLEHRDRSLAALVPPDLQKAELALPIGRMRDGTLIVCVRDPSAALDARIAAVIDGPFVIAVAPKRALERLVAQALTARATEFDIDLDAGVSGELDVDLDDDASRSFDDLLVEDVEPEPERAPEPEPEPAAPKSRALPVEFKPAAAVAPKPTAPDSLEGVIAALADVDELEWLFDVVMTYIAKTWKASLLLAVHDGVCTGARGHGQDAGAVSIPLRTTPLLQRANDERRLVYDTRDQRLSSMLGRAERPVAAPVLRADVVTHVIAVGDPRSGDAEEAAVELGMLAESIGEALARINASSS